MPSRKLCLQKPLKMSEEHKTFQLNESIVDPNPFAQFDAWFKEALQAEFQEPTAMALATADAAGFPSVRMVLLKSYDERGFVFFTNYGSRKGRDLSQNPRASLLFWWDKMGRQIRIEGDVEKVREEESSQYFSSRPRGSQLGAWASRQSTVIAGREELEDRLLEFEREFRGKPVPRPQYWGGYRVIPLVFQFWQSRPNRLHDRLQYRKLTGGGWVIERLAP